MRRMIMIAAVVRFIRQNFLTNTKSEDYTQNNLAAANI